MLLSTRACKSCHMSYLTSFHHTHYHLLLQYITVPDLPAWLCTLVLSLRRPGFCSYSWWFPFAFRATNITKSYGNILCHPPRYTYSNYDHSYQQHHVAVKCNIFPYLLLPIYQNPPDGSSASIFFSSLVSLTSIVSIVKIIAMLCCSRYLLLLSSHYASSQLQYLEIWKGK